MMDPDWTALALFVLFMMAVNVIVAVAGAVSEILRLVAADVRQAWENLCRRP